MHLERYDNFIGGYKASKSEYPETTCVVGGFVGILSSGPAKRSGKAARGMGRRNFPLQLHRLHFHQAPTKPAATQATTEIKVDIRSLLNFP